MLNKKIYFSYPTFIENLAAAANIASSLSEQLWYAEYGYDYQSKGLHSHRKGLASLYSIHLSSSPIPLSQFFSCPQMAMLQSQ